MIPTALTATLQQQWKQVSTQAVGPQLIYLHGPAGSGKSHLLHHTFEDDYRRITLHAPNLIPQVIGALHDRLSSTRHPEFLHYLKSARPDLTWPVVATAMLESNPAAHLRQLAETLAQQAHEHQGQLLIVDELERAQNDDTQFILQCWRTLAQQHAPALLLIAGQQPEPAGHDDATRIAALTPGTHLHTHHLQPLDENGIHSLIREALGPADTQLIPWLHARSAGHPLHAIQLLNHLRAGGFLKHHAGTWLFTPPTLAELPGNLNQLLTTRWQAALDAPHAPPLLHTLALAEQPLTLQELQALTGLPAATLRRTLEHLEGQQIARTTLQEGQETITLAHPTFAAIGRKNLTHTHETEIHTRLARSHLNIHTRARHARQANLAEAETLTRDALHAAQQTSHASLTAEHAEALLDLLINAPHGTRDDLLTTLARALIQLNRLPEAIHHLNQIENPSVAALEAHAKALMNQGEYKAGLDLLTTKASTPLDPALDVLQARILVQSGSAELAEDKLDLLLKSEDVNLVQVRMARAHLWMLQKRAHKIIEEVNEAFKETCSDHERADLLNFLGLAKMWTAEFAESEAAFTQCAELLKFLGRESALVNVYTNLASLYSEQSLLNDAREAIALAVKLAKVGGNALTLKNLEGNLGIIQLFLGEKSSLIHIKLMQEYYAKNLPAHAPEITLYLVQALTMFCLDQEAEELLETYQEDHYLATRFGHLTLAQTKMIFGDFTHAQHLLEIAPDYTDDLLCQIQLTYYQALLAALKKDFAQAEHLLNLNFEHPKISTYPSVHAEHQWALLGVLHRNGGNESRKRQLGGQVAEFLTFSGGKGHLIIFDRLFPEDREARHAYLQNETPIERQAFLRTLGHFDLEENGEVKQWKARKVRELLAALLCAHVSERGPAVTREELTLALWPELPDTQAEANFRKTLTRLREALGHAAQIERLPNGYALTGLHADLNLFLKALNDRDLSAACAWYEGPFLPGVDLPAVTELRDSLHTRWRDAALQLAQEQPTPQAARLLSQLLREDPFDPDALSLLPTYAADPDGSIKRLCQKLAKQHREELGEVAPEVQAVLAS